MTDGKLAGSRGCSDGLLIQVSSFGAFFASKETGGYYTNRRSTESF